MSVEPMLSATVPVSQAPSGITSPSSKPGTPVPGPMQSDFLPHNPIFRTTSATGSGAIDRLNASLERTSLDPRAHMSRTTSSTTPGKERPGPGAGISMKKVQIAQNPFPSLFQALNPTLQRLRCTARTPGLYYTKCMGHLPRVALCARLSMSPACGM